MVKIVHHILFRQYLLPKNERTYFGALKFTDYGCYKKRNKLECRNLRFLEPESNMPPRSPLSFEDGKALREGLCGDEGPYGMFT